MDKSEVKRIIDEHIRFMVWDMQLQKWEIETTLDVLEDGDHAVCVADHSYSRASITIDYTRCKDEADVLSTLRHELSHILHAPFDTYRRSIRHLVQDDGAWEAMEHVYETAAEQTRTAIENMLRYGYGIMPGKRADYVAPSVNPYAEEPEIPHGGAITP